MPTVAPFFRTNMEETLDKAISDGINNLPQKSNDENHFSPLNPAKIAGNNTPGFAQLHVGVCNALARIAQNEMTVVSVTDTADTYACEIPIEAGGKKTGEYIVVRASKLGSYMAGIFSIPGNKMQSASLPPLGTPELLKLPYEVLYAPIVLFAAEIAGIADKVDKVIATLRSGVRIDTDAEAVAALYQLCAAARNAVKQNKISPSVTGGNFNAMTAMNIENRSCCGSVKFGPQPTFLFGMDEKALRASGSIPTTMKDAMAEFESYRAEHSARFTDAEREFIPTFDDDFPVPAEAVKMCRRYVNTKGSKRPMVNPMWRGITSYGKSTGVEVMAALLGMPLVRMTCSSTMETQDFLATFVPVVSGDTDKAQAVVATLPSFEDILNDPETAYEMLTGVEKEGVGYDEVMTAYAAAVLKNAPSTGKNSQFKLVESNFIQALEHGWICEVQEISRIKDPGVLVGLNEYDRPNAVIPLVDGRKARRHPDAIVVYTDNVGYASSRPLDQAVIRRMSYIIDSYELPEEKVLERVRYNTGFDDDHMLKEMYDVWANIQKTCKKMDITEGSTSVSELEMWVLAVMADGKSHLRETCMECVVAKATSVPEEQTKLKTSVLDTATLFAEDR